MRKLLSFLPRLWTNWITLLGSVITTVSGCTLILGVAADLISPFDKPYTAAAVYMIMPGLFIFGLMVIPVGFLWERRKTRKRKDHEPEPDPIREAFQAALQDKRSRRRIVFLLVATFANIIILGAAGHSAMVFMDSPRFCGTLCHTVMQPEYQAYLRSPHSRVACVDCHIGPGASWAVKAKLDGLRQVWAVMTDGYSRPIPSPVHALRPARDTCEQCHWPAKFLGNRVAIFTHYADDEANTPEVNALLLKVGGVNPRTGRYQGIHWHVSPDIEVRYQTLDEKRERIGKVTWMEKGEIKGEFIPPGDLPEPLEERVMDCVDCHNRPTHIYDQSPRLAVNQAFLEGRLDTSVPFLGKLAVQVLDRSDVPRDDARRRFRELLEQLYDEQHADLKPAAKVLDASAAVLAELYRRNVFPEMKVGWDTYPTHLGHRGDEGDKRGCFRCHDDEHATKDERVLRQDCDLCHEILHEEESPEELPESLRALMHPAG